MDSSGAGVSEVLVMSYTRMLYFTLGRTEAFCSQLEWQYHGLYARSFQIVVWFGETKREMHTKI